MIIIHLVGFNSQFVHNNKKNGRGLARTRFLSPGPYDPYDILRSEEGLELTIEGLLLSI